MQVNWPLGPRMPVRAPLNHPCLQTNVLLEDRLPLVLKGKRGSCSWDGHAGWLRLPGNSGGSPSEMSIFIQESYIVLDMVGTRLIFNWYGATYSVLISQAFLQKLYCDWCQWKASHLLVHWASHLPVWTVFDLTCLFGCAWVLYSTTREDLWDPCYY